MKGLSSIRNNQGHFGIINCITISHDGKFFVSGSDDKLIKLWSIHDGIELFSIVNF